MPAIRTSADLSRAILEMEVQRNNAREAIRQQVKLTYESFVPSRLLKTAFKEFSISHILNSSFARTLVALLVGHVSKAVFIGSSKSWARRYLGYFLFVSLTNIMMRNPGILNTVGAWLKNIGSKEASKEADKMAEDES